MKKLALRWCALALLFAAAETGFAADTAPAGQIDFGKFTPPAAGGEFVEVNIRGYLIAMAAKLTEKADPDIAALLRGIKGVRVNVVGMDDQNRAELTKRIKAIHDELDKKGWDRIVTAQKQKEDVGVFVKARGEEAIEGLVVTVMEGGREAVFVNIVGDIKPEKIAVIGEKFNIDPLKKISVSVPK